MPKHINIITLGCSKNLVDSEYLIGNLKAKGYKVTHESLKPANIIIINTCGFIEDAKDESIETILKYANDKKSGKTDTLIVTGCLSQRYKKELLQEIPEVDAFFGVYDQNNLLKFIDKNHEKFIPQRCITTPSHYAYLKIAEGCDRTCSFCAIPIIKGKYHSKSIKSITEEANELAKKGVKELLVIAQDISYYGIDIKRKKLLGELLEELVKINNIEWIKLHYGYPLNFPDNVIDMMADNEKICRYIDIPLQHINDSILKSMKRGVNKKHNIKLIENLRKKVPEIAVRTTFMVGYPGETKRQFNELLQFVKDTKFDRLGVFKYSAEEDTPAWKLKDDVPDEVKEERMHLIMEEQQKISLELNKNKIEKSFKVIIDRKEGDYMIGRTEFDSPEIDNEVLIKNSCNIIKPGDFLNVVVEDASEFDIYGSIVKC